MKIEKLLFPTKFREGALYFLKKLLIFRKVGLKEVEILHVIEKDKVAYDIAGYLKELEEKLRAEAQKKLDEWKKEIESEVDRVVTKIVVGIPEYEILAESRHVDIVGSGKPKSGFLRRLFFGSTTLNFLAEIEKPTVLAKLEEKFLQDDRELYERVVFATDGSAPCDRALDFLVTIAPILGKVDLLSVANTDRKEKTESFEEMINSYSEKLKACGVETEIHLIEGKPSKEIVKLADAVNATMIVMGTTGKDKFEELVLGSASHRVMEMAKVPITMVP